MAMTESEPPMADAYFDGMRDASRGLPPAVDQAPTYREPPHNLEAEQALLGAILANNRAFEKVCDFLRPNHFADPVHGRIYGACAALIDRGQIATPVTLKGMFDQDEALEEVGGAQYLINLVASVVTVINAGDYGREIRDCYLRREIIEACDAAMNEAFDRDIDVRAEDLVDKTYGRFDAIVSTGGDGSGGPVTAADGVNDALRAIEDAYRRGGELVGVSTGLTDLDDLTAGMANGDLILLAGRPSMGKSALARTIAWNHSAKDGRMLLFSPEMTDQQQYMALLAARTGISVQRLRKGRVEDHEWQKLHDAAAIIGSTGFQVDKRSGITVAQIRSTLRRLRGSQKPTLIVVDYLQLMRPDREHSRKVDEVGSISLGLKAIAKEWDVPVVALSQLSRSLETREDKRPMLPDLRDSGNLEQDADHVWFVYREEYYLQKAEPKQRAGEDLLKYEGRRSSWLTQMEKARGLAEVIVAKNRLGPLGTCRLHFDGAAVRFDNLERRDWS